MMKLSHSVLSSSIPEKKSKDIDVRTYLNKITSGKWKLHDIQRDDTTWNDGLYFMAIDSLFKNLLISNFVISLHSSTEGYILDGGHRTRALVNFVNNKIGLRMEDGSKVFWEQLCEADQECFYDKQISVVVYENLNARDEEDLFFRLNLGLNLSIGDYINAYRTIPLCALAKEMGLQYAERLKSNFNKLITKDNVFADSSTVMMMILENFQAGTLVRGEKPTITKREEIQAMCESLRYVEFDEVDIRKKVEKLMDIVCPKVIEKKWLGVILPSVQAIILEDPECDPEDVRDFLFQVHTFETSVFYQKWYSLSRDMISNPGYPQHCQERAKLFLEWRET
jgi:hypothetical protein